MSFLYQEGHRRANVVICRFQSTFRLQQQENEWWRSLFRVNSCDVLVSIICWWDIKSRKSTGLYFSTQGRDCCVGLFERTGAASTSMASPSCVFLFDINVKQTNSKDPYSLFSMACLCAIGCVEWRRYFPSKTHERTPYPFQHNHSMSFSTLSDEILLHVFLFLDAGCIARISSVCSRWSRISGNRPKSCPNAYS